MADCQAGREQNALALRLRHLAGECRDLRRGNEWERKWEGVFFQLNEVFGAAICARSVPEPILESVNKNPQAIRGGLVLGREFKLPFAVLGYHPSTFTSFVEPDEYDDETHCMSLGERYVILRPGYVSSAWPGVFPEIESPVPDGVSLKDAAEDLYRSETFSIVGFYAMACDLLAEWIYKQSAEDGSAAGGGEPEAENESRSEMSLQSAALDAVVRSGLAGVVQQAAGASAIDRASAAMRKLFETDRGEYGSWSAERWAEHLGVSKKTVVGTRNKPNKAWKDVMAWRASNKAERVSKETLK